MNCPGCNEVNGVFTIMGMVAHFNCRYCGWWYKLPVDSLTEYWTDYEYPEEYEE